jgi:hypothetical protein
MARRLGAQALTAPNVARVARAIGAAGVVHGRIDRARRRGKDRRKARRAREVVTIYVRDGESGRVVEKHRVRVGRGRAARRSEAALDRSLLARLEVPAAYGGGAGRAGDAVEAEAATPRRPRAQRRRSGARDERRANSASARPRGAGKVTVASTRQADPPAAKKPPAKVVAKNPAAKVVAKKPTAKVVAK